LIPALLGENATKGPIGHVIVGRMIKIRGVNNLLGLLIATLYKWHVSGLVRSGEGTSGLLGNDFVFEMSRDHDGVSRRKVKTMVDRTKTHRKGDPTSIVVGDNDSDPLSAVKLVSEWKRRAGIKAGDWMFPHIIFEKGVPVGIDFTRSLTYDTFKDLIKLDVETLGLDPRLYGGHSFRAGGATDLFASGLLVLAQIMKIGRWRSVEACMVYYREDVEVAGRAAEIFGSMYDPA
jgi:hypothetical protein